MQTPPSPLDTLRQLKEMLDAGALTPAEFEALKQRLVFEAPGHAPATPAPAAPRVPIVPPAYSEPIPVLPEELPASAGPSETAIPTYRAEPLPTGPELAPLSEPAPAWQTSGKFSAEVVEAPASNPLALTLSIGGVLVFLAVVAYLSFNQPSSERVSSTSMTAADSAATVIETGPQAAPLLQSAAVSETVRVAPTNPAPPTQPRPAPSVSDSATAPVPATGQDSVAGQ